RSAPRSRSATMRPRVVRHGRTTTRRKPVRGSGRPPTRRSRRAGEAAERVARSPTRLDSWAYSRRHSRPVEDVMKGEMDHMPSQTRARPPNGHRIDGSILDARDRRVLDTLSADARIRKSARARRVGMSAPAVRERVNRLEKAGVIRGYRADI